MKRFTKGFYGFLSIWVLFLAILSGCGGGGGNSPAPTSDTTAPTNTTASDFISSGASSTSSTTVTLAISATDSVGVTGYYASETSTAPSASASGWIVFASTTSYSANVSFTLSSGDGTKTVYVWFKDAAGNVSASASDSISLAATLASKIVGTWGEVTLYHNNDSTWDTEVCKFTYNSDYTGASTCQMNYGGTLETGADTFTYTVVSNSDGSLTTTKTFTSDGAIRTHRWVMGDDGNVMILDGTTNTDKQRLRVLVRLDTAKTYNNADLIGDYYFGRYIYNGSYGARSGIETFDGAGSKSGSRTDNTDGSITTGTGTGTYSVNSDGSFTLDGGATGYLTGDGKLGISGLVTTTDTWILATRMKKGDKTYSTADLAGTWAYINFGDNDGTSFLAVIGAETCTSSGVCSYSEKHQTDGSVSYKSGTNTFSVASDGSITDTNNSSKIMAIGNNGNTIIVNNSFDTSNPGKRRIAIKVKCSACGDLAQVPQYTASGTYTYASGTINFNWTSSDFTCEGPTVGTSTETGVTITSTTMTFPNITWTRSSGTAGDIVGTWTASDSTTGNSWTLTFNANGTSSVTGVIVSCSGVSQFDGTYTGTWSKTCPACGVTDTTGTFTITVVNGVFTNTIITNTSGGDNSAPRLDSGTVSSSGAITGTGATPSQCSSSVTTFTGQMTTTSSMTMTFSRPASSGVCQAESGTLTGSRL